jgi:hypothetical protein
MTKYAALPLMAAGALSLLIGTNAHANHHCANLPGLKLTVKEYHLDLNDNRPICVTIPGEFSITIHNPPGSGVSVGSGDVTAGQKDVSGEPDVEISGDNSSPSNKLTIKIEGDAEDGDEFEFWIEVDGVGYLDPKVKVIDSDMQMRLQFNAVDEAMGAWNLGFEDALKLRPPADKE